MVGSGSRITANMRGVEKYHERKEKGLCIRCGKKQMKDKIYCRKCYELKMKGLEKL